MKLPPLKDCERILKLYRLMKDPAAAPAEVNGARKHIERIILKYGIARHDLEALIAEIEVVLHVSTPPTPPASGKPEVNVLDLTLSFLERYVVMTDDQRMAVALWALHTWVYDQFIHTPRLAVLSPVNRCGKSTLLILLELLCHDPSRSDNVTAAAIYEGLSHGNITLLLDEGDNLGIFKNPVLRSVFNSGHRRGGNVRRYGVSYSTFAPLAVAAIGKVPLPLLDRSVIISMRRRGRDQPKPERLDETDSDTELEIAGSREQFQLFAQTCQLKRNPDIPPALDDRAADNWRPLLAIADALGHGDKARAAAERLCAARPLDEDPAVVCLTDIRKVFDTSKRDRITSIALVLALRDLEDRPWNEWRGRHSDRAPHPLTQRELAELLSDFEIYPRTVWPLGSRRGKRSRSGYYRSQFEQAWRDYCLQSHTPTHPQKQKRIPLPKKGNREE